MTADTRGALPDAFRITPRPHVVQNQLVNLVGRSSNVAVTGGPAQNSGWRLIITFQGLSTGRRSDLSRDQQS